jgi:hypothetical protein
MREIISRATVSQEKSSARSKMAHRASEAESSEAVI